MKRFSLLLIWLILGLELKSQVDFGKSNYFLPLKHSKNNSVEINILDQKSQKIIFEIKKSKIKSTDEIQLLLWDKFGNSQIINGVFKNQNQFILPDSVVTLWSKREFKFSFIQDSQIVWEKSISNIEKFNSSIDENKDITQLQFRINDNLATNKELGKINNKIELGETFVFKYLLKTEDNDNRYKIWFSVDQPGIKCNLDTAFKKGNLIQDSVKFSCPFSYPKYGKSFTVKMHYLNLITKITDSSQVEVIYNNYLGIELTSPFVNNSEITTELNKSVTLEKELLISNDIIEINKIEDKIVLKQHKLHFSKYIYSIILSTKSQNDSFEIVNSVLNNIKFINDTITYSIDSKFKNDLYSLSYRIEKKSKYKLAISVGLIGNPIEFRNSTSSNLMPIGLHLRLLKKSGFSVYFLSNFANLNSDFEIDNPTIVLPNINLLKYDYTLTDKFHYKLMEFGILKDFRIGSNFLFSVGGRYSNFQYAAIVNQINVINNSNELITVQVKSESFIAIDPYAEFNCILEKLNLGIGFGTRNHRISNANVNFILGYRF